MGSRVRARRGLVMRGNLFLLTAKAEGVLGRGGGVGEGLGCLVQEGVALVMTCQYGLLTTCGDSRLYGEELTCLPVSSEPETASEAFWVADFSPWGWTEPATESAAPLTLSPACSVVDFWLSGLRLEATLSASVGMSAYFVLC